MKNQKLRAFLTPIILIAFGIVIIVNNNSSYEASLLGSIASMSFVIGAIWFIFLLTLLFFSIPVVEKISTGFFGIIMKLVCALFIIYFTIAVLGTFTPIGLMMNPYVEQ